jgi:hypothetical protein
MQRMVLVSGRLAKHLRPNEHTIAFQMQTAIWATRLPPSMIFLRTIVPDQTSSEFITGNTALKVPDQPRSVPKALNTEAWVHPWVQWTSRRSFAALRT